MIVIIVGTSFLDSPSPRNASRSLRYSDFIEAVQDNQISRVMLSPDRGTAQVVESDGSRAEVNLAPDKDLLKLLTDHDVDIAVQPTTQPGPWQQAASSLIFPVLLLGGLFFLFRRSQGSGGGNPVMNFGKSKARLQMEPSTKVTFGDVAGIEGAKLELTEVVDFLKSPDRFTAVGAKIPKGVLLVGPPGTGKTLLAKAVAGEAEVPFFSISGSEFVEMFVGVGASRVRDLFEQAKKNAPCIVFIDEIDSIGRQRGAGIGGGNDEREQTLNQLLTEMDGFASNNGVIVIAATNRPDILDRALIRPGRFDRRIDISLPDKNARYKILSVHARTKPLTDEINLKEWASKTPGFSGADLQNLLNEAAINAARKEKSSISNIELENALEKARFGLLSKPLSDNTKKRQIAYQIIGKTLVSLLITFPDRLEKVSLFKSLGDIAGMTYFTPDEETINSGLITRSYIYNKIVVLLGSRAAEYIIFGSKEVTQGSQKDLENVYFWANQMVTKFGFSDLGPIAYESQDKSIFLGRDIMQNKKEYSQKTSKEIDSQIISIVKNAVNHAIKLLSDKVLLMDQLVDELIDKETLDAEYIITSLNSFLSKQKQ